MKAKSAGRADGPRRPEPMPCDAAAAPAALAQGRRAVHARFVGQIGVLGWIIVTPTLIGLFIGRWLDHRLGTGIFWSAPLLLVGVVIGCWSAWRWMHQQ